jgi:hypothetical protein
VPRSSRSSATTSTVVRLHEPEVGAKDGRTIVDGVSFNFTARAPGGQRRRGARSLDALGLPRPERVDVEFSRWRGEELPLPAAGS